MKVFDASLEQAQRDRLAPDSMLTSLQITLINDNSEWKRPFVLWGNAAGRTPALNVAFMSQGHRLPSQAASGGFFRLWENPGFVV